MEMLTQTKSHTKKCHLTTRIITFYGLCVIVNLSFAYGSSDTRNNVGTSTIKASLVDDEVLQIPVVKKEDSIEDTERPTLSSWSDWSQCDREKCSQHRSRRCEPLSETALCKGTVIEEKRFCSKPHQCKRNTKNSITIKGSKIFEKQPFQVVKRPSKNTLRSMRKSSPARKQAQQTRTQRIRRKFYSRWSHWTMCSKSCTTQRFRWCKRTAICGNDVLSESALCYIEGSYCERWIQKRLGEASQEELVTNVAKINVDNDSNNNYASKPKDPPPRRPMRAPKDEANIECGYTANSSYSSYSLDRWNMLRIIGGRPSRRGKWPWQVALLNRFKEAFCGGTLISSMWVVTAAHCIRKKLYIRLGEFDLTNKEGSELEFKVERAIKHPNYDSETVDNDIALLKLPDTVAATTSGQTVAKWLPVCLPRGFQPLPPSATLCTIIGWGKRKSTDHYGTDILHEAQVPIVSNNECREVYDEYRITENMFCAGYRGGRMDSCSGDSGGPLLCREAKTNQWTIHGITSFGEGCGRKGKFGIYTRMSNYVKWARSVMRDYS